MASMAATTACSSLRPTISPFPRITRKNPSNSLRFVISFKPIAITNSNSALKFSRRRVTFATPVAPKRAYRASAISAGDPSTFPEAESNDSKREATIDLKLPRRSLLAEFTCNDCGERTKRLISRLAYERGVVYVQCAGCEKYHKLVDNLGLVVEYDFRDENLNEDNA